MEGKLKLIRGVGRCKLEKLTDDLFENMDNGSRKALMQELVMYRDNNFSTLKYDTILAQFDTQGKMLRDYNPIDSRVDVSEYTRHPTSNINIVEDMLTHRQIRTADPAYPYELTGAVGLKAPYDVEDENGY